MEQTIVQSNVDEILDPSQEIIEEIVEIVEHVAPVASAKPSYQPTRWPQVNALLDKVDDITNGRAGSLVQFATFLVFGGTTTIINLAIVYVAYYRIPMPALTDAWHSLLATVLGCELSLTCNFLLNDNFTFKNMPGRSRSLLARFWRFQTTGIVGTLTQPCYCNRASRPGPYEHPGRRSHRGHHRPLLQLLRPIILHLRQTQTSQTSLNPFGWSRGRTVGVKFTLTRLFAPLARLPTP